MRVSALAEVLATTGSRLPLTVAFEESIRRDVGRRWYRDQREHMLGWMSEYDRPGAYGRAQPGQDAAFLYNHLRCPPALVHIAEAAGESAEIITAGVEAIRQAPGNLSSQSAAFRRVVPWRRVEELLGSRPVSTARRLGLRRP